MNLSRTHSVYNINESGSNLSNRRCFQPKLDTALVYALTVSLGEATQVRMQPRAYSVLFSGSSFGSGTQQHTSVCICPSRVWSLFLVSLSVDWQCLDECKGVTSAMPGLGLQESGSALSCAKSIMMMQSAWEPSHGQCQVSSADMRAI